MMVYRSFRAVGFFFAVVVCLVLVAVPWCLAIELDDPVNYRIKQIWSAESLGIPVQLGALLFSKNGDTLYVVGRAEQPMSALYAVPVTRDPITRQVTDLGPAELVSIAFYGNPDTPGLDAGLEFGPSGTLFYTYWSANYLGERPGGIGGAETQFDMASVGLARSISGLTFSPHATDPGTDFGQMQVSVWFSPYLYEIPLTPRGGGIFEPGTPRLFVTLPLSGTGGMQYVPSGGFRGSLMYANWDYGQIRVLAVDPVTGWPIDAGTGLPTLGTENPVDVRFASDLGVGPWGIEFDADTNDLFVSTYSGNPYNSIIQIEGFPLLQVSIDIKPGSYPNSINLGSDGTVPVAILSTPAFNASTVQPESVTLAGASVKLKGKGTPMASLQDVNGDGLQDLVVHVSTEALELSDADTEAILTGKTVNGSAIRGKDSVRIVH